MRVIAATTCRAISIPRHYGVSHEHRPRPVHREQGAVLAGERPRQGHRGQSLFEGDWGGEIEIRRRERRAPVKISIARSLFLRRSLVITRVRMGAGQEGGEGAPAPGFRKVSHALHNIGRTRCALLDLSSSFLTL